MHALVLEEGPRKEGARPRVDLAEARPSLRSHSKLPPAVPGTTPIEERGNHISGERESSKPRAENYLLSFLPSFLPSAQTPPNITRSPNPLAPIAPRIGGSATAGSRGRGLSAATRIAGSVLACHPFFLFGFLVLFCC